MSFRHEIKIPINSFDRVVLSSRLSACLPRDVNAGPDGSYLIRSLYFDTPYDTALREKLAGVDRREKFRIRIYNGCADGRIMLEKKVKVNGLSGKENAVLTIQECRMLLAGEYSWMARDERTVLNELYIKIKTTMLSPKTIIEYKREAFTYLPCNIRITIDSDIRTGLFSSELFKRELPLVPAADGFIVMEVKYDTFIPDFITDILRIGSRGQAACSKYTIGRRFG